MENHVYPTNITLVRQANAHAINYTDVSAKAFDGSELTLMVPEYPIFKDFYVEEIIRHIIDNITLAESDLKQANVSVSSFPTFSLNVLTGCQACVNVAQVIQGDLAQIGSLGPGKRAESNFIPTYTGTYTEAVQNAQANGQLTLILGGNGWAPNLYIL